MLCWNVAYWVDERHTKIWLHCSSSFPPLSKASWTGTNCNLLALHLRYTSYDECLPMVFLGILMGNSQCVNRRCLVAHLVVVISKRWFRISLSTRSECSAQRPFVLTGLEFSTSTWIIPFMFHNRHNIIFHLWRPAFAVWLSYSPLLNHCGLLVPLKFTVPIRTRWGWPHPRMCRHIFQHYVPHGIDKNFAAIFYELLNLALSTFFG